MRTSSKDSGCLNLPWTVMRDRRRFPSNSCAGVLPRPLAHIATFPEKCSDSKLIGLVLFSGTLTGSEGGMTCCPAPGFSRSRAGRSGHPSNCAMSGGPEGASDEEDGCGE